MTRLADVLAVATAVALAAAVAAATVVTAFGGGMAHPTWVLFLTPW